MGHSCQYDTQNGLKKGSILLDSFPKSVPVWLVNEQKWTKNSELNEINKQKMWKWTWGCLRKLGFDLKKERIPIPVEQWAAKTLLSPFFSFSFFIFSLSSTFFPLFEKISPLLDLLRGSEVKWWARPALFCWLSQPRTMLVSVQPTIGLAWWCTIRDVFHLIDFKCFSNVYFFLFKILTLIWNLKFEWHKLILMNYFLL